MAKPYLNYLLLANRAIHDSASNRWSYIDVFDTFVITAGLDFTYQSFAVIGKISNVPAGKNTMVIDIVSPSNKVTASTTLEGDLVDGGANVVARFELIKFEEVGTYRIKITNNGVALTSKNSTFDVAKGKE